MKGTKKQIIRTVFAVGGRELRLVYDTTAGPTAKLWNTNFHKDISYTTSSNAGAVVANRGSGVSVGFESVISASSVCGVNAGLSAVDSVSKVGNGFEYKDEKAKALELYDATGHLSAIYKASGQIITNTYSDATTPLSIAPASGYLLKASDTKGKSISFEYVLAAGQPAATGARISKITNSAGQAITLGYDTAGNLSTLTWPDAKVRTFVYEDSNNPWALTGIVDENNSRFATWTYTLTGQALSSEHAGGVEKVSVLYAAGLPSVPTIRKEVRGSTLCRFHEIVAPSSLSMVSANGQTATATIDSSMGYPRLAGLTQPAGSGCLASTSAAAFDAKGDVTSKDNFRGTRTCYVYDAKHQETLRVEGLANTVACATVTDPSASLPAGARRITTQWHPDWRVPTVVTAPGAITTKIYQGQPDPFNGNVAANCTAAAVLPNGKAGPLVCKQVIQAIDALSNIDPSVPTQVLSFTYDASGRALTSKDSLNRTTNYAYYTDTAFTGVDPVAVGHTVGDLQTVTDAKGFVTTFNSYDKSGRVLQMTNPKGIVTAMAYTPRGRIDTVTVTAPGVPARLTKYNYDNVGQLIDVQSADGTTVGYTYDAAHRLTGATDARGNSVTYTLDAMSNRLSEQLKDPGGVLQRTMSRTYDALNRVQQLQLQ